MINDSLLSFTEKGGDLFDLETGSAVCSKTVDLAATGAVDEELFLTVGYKEASQSGEVYLTVTLRDVDTHAVFMSVYLVFPEAPSVQQVRIPRHSPPFKGVLECEVFDPSGSGNADSELLEIFLTNSQQDESLEII